jgi:hypothetical protein
MPKEYKGEELWKLYEKLPKELKEVIFAEETANHINEICKRYEVPEEKVPEIAKEVGNGLLEILPPNEFEEILEKEIKLEEEIVKRVAQEIYRFIFYHVKASLEEVYKIEISSPAQPRITPPTKEKPNLPPQKDIYREPIE